MKQSEQVNIFKNKVKLLVYIPGQQWTEKMALAYSLKYSTKTEFKQKYRKAYLYITENKLETKAFKHMEKYKQNRKIEYDKEDTIHAIKDLSFNYTNRKEFQKDFPKLYKLLINKFLAESLLSSLSEGKPFPKRIRGKNKKKAEHFMFLKKLHKTNPILYKFLKSKNILKDYAKYYVNQQR